MIGGKLGYSYDTLNEKKTKTITNREIYCDCWGLFILISKKQIHYIRDEFFHG